MSEPVTNADVEDVLSSIRRLVSEEKRSRQTAEGPQGADKLLLTPAQRVSEQPAGSDQDTVGETAKQLFDPNDDLPADVYSRDRGHDMGWDGNDTAFFDDLGDAEVDPDEETFTPPPRAMDDGAEASADPADDYTDDPYGFADDDDADEMDTVAQQPSRVTLIDPVAESGYAEEDEADQAESADVTGDAEAETPEADDDMFDFDLMKARHQEADEALPEAESDAEAAPQSTAPEEDAPEEPVTAEAQASKAATLSAKIAALETAIGNIADTWEPDTPGTDDYSGTDQPAMAWEDDVSRDATGVPLRGETASAPWQEAHPDVVMIGTVRAAANAAAAAAAREAEQAEQETVAQTPPSAPQTAAELAAADEQAAKDRAIAAARAAAAERLAADRRAAEHHAQSMAAERAAAEPSAPADTTADAADESQVLDEETLRAIVSEIVRSELQGALGERITRNVRKLVRREIHRALTAQELE